MYCENCGNKLNTQDLFCEECGTKTNKTIPVQSNNSNKTLWIILSCVFGGLFLIILLGILFFSIVVTDYNRRIDEVVDYDVKEPYEYDYGEEIESF